MITHVLLNLCATRFGRKLKLRPKMLALKLSIYPNATSAKKMLLLLYSKLEETLRDWRTSSLLWSRAIVTNLGTKSAAVKSFSSTTLANACITTFTSLMRNWACAICVCRPGVHSSCSFTATVTAYWRVHSTVPVLTMLRPTMPLCGLPTYRARRRKRMHLAPTYYTSTLTITRHCTALYTKPLPGPATGALCKPNTQQT